MSLTGNLEDLPLLDILQIVTYSRKTGFLTIEGSAGLGSIVFFDGLVVSAFTPASQLLASDPSLPPEKRQAAVRTRIEIALEQLIRLREGSFEFSLTDEVPMSVQGHDISSEILEEGFNAQGLLLDLARGIDEDRRNSAAALEASFVQPPEPLPGASIPPADSGFDEEFEVSEADLGPLSEELSSIALEEVQAASEPPVATAPLVPAAASAPAPLSNAVRQAESASAPVAGSEAPVVLLVDDEPDVRQVLAESITAAGFPVIEAEDPDAALKKAHRLGKAGMKFLLVCDLGMPTSGGSSFQGGFEVVKRLMKMHLNPPVLMMAERVNSGMQARARQLGIASLVFKPGLSKLDPEQFRSDLRAFAGRLTKDILPGLRARAVVTEPKVAKPKPEGAAARALATVGEESSREILVLQERLEELRHQTDPTQISLMVMKTAREFFERGILLLIKDAEARGLAAFGPAPRGENISLLVRDIAVPLAETSIFAEVVTRRKPVFGVPIDGRWMAHLYGKIGRYQATSAAILPILAHRETIGLLFGDNPETGREAKRVDALALFVDQTGLALENVFLQRKVQSLEKSTPQSA